MSTFKPQVFFAIPCGEYYEAAANAIRSITKVVGIDSIIIEDDPLTMGLWYKLSKQIESADLFVADISSKSPNIMLELGYAMKCKPIENIGIFVSATAPVLSDLRGFVYQEYSSFSDFKDKLVEWLCAVIPLLDQTLIKGQEVYRHPGEVFYDDFKSEDKFLKRWSFLPGSSALLPLEGLKISDAPFPILTTTLGILRDCVFEFRARIDRNTIGWVVKGTRNFNSSFPAFFVMFNLNQAGILTPHIWHQRHPDPKSLITPFPLRDPIKIKANENGWFTLITRVIGDTIEIDTSTETVFSQDFSKEPYASLYNDFPDKDGQVGFRCDTGEVATIQYVRVRELSTYSSATRQQ